MKKIEIIVMGEHLQAVQDLLDEVKVTGYTIIPNISGKGHHGLHEGHLMFNEIHSMVMIITVVPKSLVSTILAGLDPLFKRHSGVAFMSDVEVARRGYFEPADS